MTLLGKSKLSSTANNSKKRKRGSRVLSNNENKNEDRNENKRENERESIEIVRANSINSHQNYVDHKTDDCTTKNSDINNNHQRNFSTNISTNTERILKSEKASGERTWGAQILELCDGTNGTVKPTSTSSSSSFSKPISPCLDFLTEIKSQGEQRELNLISVFNNCWHLF